LVPASAATTATIPTAALAAPKSLGTGEAERLELVGGVRQKGDRASAFDRRAQAPLVLGTGAGRAARFDARSIGQKPAEPVDVLVIDVVDLVDAELANASTVVVLAKVASGTAIAAAAAAAIAAGCGSSQVKPPGNSYQSSVISSVKPQAGC
jgi:hypothetical protein